jgi:hypothetical protein
MNDETTFQCASIKGGRIGVAGLEYGERSIRFTWGATGLYRDLTSAVISDGPWFGNELSSSSR